MPVQSRMQLSQENGLLDPLWTQEPNMPGLSDAAVWTAASGYVDHKCPLRSKASLCAVRIMHSLAAACGVHEP